jgi:hypothetical protein
LGGEGGEGGGNLQLSRGETFWRQHHASCMLVVIWGRTLKGSWNFFSCDYDPLLTPD